MESNRFLLECASICPETTHQKLESQCVYLTLLTDCALGATPFGLDQYIACYNL